jgi:hypothetical protein
MDLTPLAGAPITSAIATFTGCASIVSVKYPIPVSAVFNECKLSADALNTLYESLATGVTGLTLSVTENYGFSESNQSLVPAGWTIA